MPGKSQSILLGALVSVSLGLGLAFIVYNGGLVAMTLGGCAVCLTSFLGPAVAVWHYTSTNALTIPAGTGAGIGAMTAVAAALISAPINYVLRAVDVFPTVAELQERQRAIFIEQGMDPAQLDQQAGSMEWMSGPVAELVIGVVVGLIVGAIAGAIAAAVFKKGPDAEFG